MLGAVRDADAVRPERAVKAGYADAVGRLGPDPLRGNAVASRFLATLASTDCSVREVLTDQSAVAGVGNIFRSEICHQPRVHPDEPGRRLSPAMAATVWALTVDLLKRGYLDGAIATTDGAVAATGLRHYVYNEAVCVCRARVQAWAIATRTAYVYLACQPRLLGWSVVGDAAGTAAAAAAPAAPPPLPAGARDALVFPSACAPDSGAGLLVAPGKMRVVQLRAALAERGAPTDGTKPALVARFVAATAAGQPAGGGKDDAPATAAASPAAAAPAAPPPRPVGARDADVFPSACAPDSGAGLLVAPGKMRVVQLGAALAERGAPTDGTKPALVARFVTATAARAPAGGGKDDAPATAAASPATATCPSRRGRRPAADAAGRPPPAAAPAALAARAGAAATPPPGTRRPLWSARRTSLRRPARRWRRRSRPPSANPAPLSTLPR